MQPPKPDAQVQCIPSSSSLLPRGSLVLCPVAVAASLLASSASILALSLALGKKKLRGDREEKDWWGEKRQNRLEDGRTVKRSLSRRARNGRFARR